MLGDAVFDPRKARHGKGNRWARIPVTLSWGRAIARQADGAGRSLTPSGLRPPSLSIPSASSGRARWINKKRRVYNEIALEATPFSIRCLKTPWRRVRGGMRLRRNTRNRPNYIGRKALNDLAVSPYHGGAELAVMVAPRLRNPRRFSTIPVSGGVRGAALPFTLTLP